MKREGAKNRPVTPLIWTSLSSKKGKSITWMIPLVHTTFGRTTGILWPLQWIIKAGIEKNDLVRYFKYSASYFEHFRGVLKLL